MTLTANARKTPSREATASTRLAVWDALRHTPTLGDVADVYAGRPDAPASASDDPKPDWEKPKVILPAALPARGRWSLTAAPDYDGLRATQSFYGVWPKQAAPPLEALAAVLSGPVANAWIAEESGRGDVQKRVIEHVPIPELSHTAAELITRCVDRYTRLQGTAEGLNVLLKIDAAVLDAYGLSQETEAELLARFDGAPRPGIPGFTGYGAEFEQARAEHRHELAHFQQVERYQALVEKSFLDGLNTQEAQEKSHLSRDIDQESAPFHETILQGLNQGLTHGC